jgi:hypothetical protein
MASQSTDWIYFPIATNVPIPSYVRLKIVIFLLKNKMPSSKFIKKTMAKDQLSTYITIPSYVHLIFAVGKIVVVDNSFLQHTTHTTDLSLCFSPAIFRHQIFDKDCVCI